MGAGIIGPRSIIYRQSSGGAAPAQDLGTEWAALRTDSVHFDIGNGVGTDGFTQDENGWIEATVTHSTTATARNGPLNSMLMMSWDLADPEDPTSILPFYEGNGDYKGFYDAELVIEMDMDAFPASSEEAALFVGWCVDPLSLDENDYNNYKFGGWQYNTNWELKSFRSTNAGETIDSESIPNTLSPHFQMRVGSNFRMVLFAPLDEQTLDYDSQNGIEPLVFGSNWATGAFPQKFGIAIGSNLASQAPGTTYMIRFRPWWRLTHRPRVDNTRPPND
jgi:hypothetical protein